MNELQPYRDCLADVVRTCEEDLQKLPHDHPSRDDIEAVRTFAVKLTTEFVLRFGVVGDSNAGKSLLIGGLIGRADALPVNSISFTGNITILRVRPGGGERETKLGPYTVRLMTRTDARRCVEQLLGAALEQIPELPTFREVRAAGVEARARLTSELAPGPLLDWVKQLWDRSAPNTDDQGARVELELRLMELARFLTVWSRLGANICSNSEIEIRTDAKEIAEAAMVLPGRSPAKSYTEFFAEVTRLTARALPADAVPPVLTRAWAEALYPLVRDIRVEVRVPVAVWKLAELSVEAIELIDFPGSGSQSTSARDTYLARRERFGERAGGEGSERVHTWLVVMNSGQLEKCQAVNLVTGLPRNRIVAVANRFDDLPLRRDGHLTELEKISAPEAPALSAQDVLTRLPTLPPLTHICDKITEPKRCAFVSALLGLVELQESGIAGDAVSADKRKDWNNDVVQGRPSQALWRNLATKLTAREPNAPLKQWLDGYTAPAGQAGLQRLRQILFEHANTVGIQQIAQEMKDGRFPELRNAVSEVLARFDVAGDQTRGAANELHNQMDRLAAHLDERGHPPSRIEEIAVRPADVSARGGLPKGVTVLSSSVAQSRNLRELIRDEVLMRVWEWGSWGALLKHAQPDGFLRCPTETESDESDGYSSVANAKPPTRVGEFHDEFRAAYREVEQIAIAYLRVTLGAFLGELARGVGHCASELVPLTRNAQWGRNYISIALDPTNAKHSNYFFKAISTAAPADKPTDPFWRSRFPFLVYPDDDDSEKLAPGQYLGWAPERLAQRNDPPQHQVYVFRLRTELAACIEASVAQQVSEGLFAFRQAFKKMVDQSNESINVLKRDSDENLLALFGKSAASGEPSVDLGLRQLVDTGCLQLLGAPGAPVG